MDSCSMRRFPCLLSSCLGGQMPLASLSILVANYNSCAIHVNGVQYRPLREGRKGKWQYKQEIKAIQESAYTKV